MPKKTTGKGRGGKGGKGGEGMKVKAKYLNLKIYAQSKIESKSVILF